MNEVNRFTAVFIVLILLPGCASGRSADSLEKRVTKLVNETTRSARSQERALEELEELGQQAAPYLVGHLGDVRPLAVQEISLGNKASDAFEGVRHYGPSTVHDALSAVLNQITGQNFVFVYNGATAQEREENRRKWAEWCRSTYPDQAEICNGE